MSRGSPCEGSSAHRGWGALRGRTLALRWLVTFSRDRREKHMVDKLAGEILDALEQQGNAYKRKDDMYRMAQANKAFAHYRW